MKIFSKIGTTAKNWNWNPVLRAGYASLLVVVFFAPSVTVFIAERPFMWLVVEVIAVILLWILGILLEIANYPIPTRYICLMSKYWGFVLTASAGALWMFAMCIVRTMAFYITNH